MKRLAMIVALLLMVAMPMRAERVTPEAARKAATTFLNNNGMKADGLTDLSKAAGFPNLYIFTSKQGFVVMSADDCVQPILGYSLTGKFVAEGMPENLRWWLQGYSDGIQDAVESQTKASANVRRQWKELESGIALSSKTRAEVGPLITTQWDQTYPYNYYCPTCSSGGNGGHVYTGCVATAMAQVLKYHNHPAQGIGSHSYTHSTYGVQSANFGTTPYDWDNMTQKIYSGSSSTQAERQAVALLIYHCGVAVDMNYGNTGSGAYSIDIAPALINYFDYSQTTEFASRSEYADTAWINLMRAELDANRPVIYGGVDHPTAPTSGHSFVCDGYGRDGYSNYYFDFNWGWSGSYNGYFSIDDMTPGGNGAGGGNHNYSYQQDAIIGIQPASCAASAPTNLSYTASARDVTLTWDAAVNATTYSIYRNSTLIGTTNSNESVTYFDETAPYGTSTYYVRSGDSNGELSMPSNYVTVTLTFPGPTNLSAQQSSNGINLSWNAPDGAVAYNIFCNDILISSDYTETSFVDQRNIAGTLEYHVKGIDSFGDESESSNTASITIPYKTPAVTDLGVSLSGESAALSWTVPSWCYPQTDPSPLSYGNGNLSYVWRYVYYAHKHNASTMAQYTGKKLYKIKTRLYYAGTYTVYVYTNTINGNPDPDALEATNTLVCAEGQTGWREIVFDNPILISGDTDLWIVMKQEDTGKEYPVPSFNLSSYNANACYASMESPTELTPLSNSYTCSWFINAYLTDGTYTYNLYQDGTRIADDLSSTTYNTTLNDNAANQFYVKTKYYAGETTASNMIGFAKGNSSLASWEMGANDKLTLLPNSNLTVSGSLSNATAANLILEDGAQLIHSSQGVKATVKKNITAYTTEDYGWHFITPPTTEGVTPTEENGFLNGTIGEGNNTYDLYYYDEPTHYWKNYESNTFTLANKQGYLYANSNPTTLEFAGTLTKSDEDVTITGLSHSATELNGCNLVGNPFVCNATVDKDFYVIDNVNNKLILAEEDRQIAPCEGVFVQITGDDATVTFSKATTAQSNNVSECLDLVISQANVNSTKGSTSSLDRARVRFSGRAVLEKFNLGDNGCRLYIPQNGQDLAVAYANGESELPLSFKAAQNGTYTISIDAKGLELDYLHLIDNMTGNDVDLLTEPSYTFEAKTTDYASRFRMVFKAEDAGEDACVPGFAYVSDGNIVINYEGNAALQIMDAAGRMVASIDDVSENVSTSNMPAGVYVLRLITDETVKTQKIVIE